ncbi:hypothetical protein R1A30_04630 [Paenibacillus larvae]|uniref:Uncharacterized protein n=1 Tax=Paenibacillus larvae TaxID=1464 RepID=A0AAP5JXK4_9BACL|nr:hypothetical protein [Paenibacillus larvae]MDV3483623.1 hypothetical protein [Paenibacillus larvae]
MSLSITEKHIRIAHSEGIPAGRTQAILRLITFPFYHTANCSMQRF